MKVAVLSGGGGGASFLRGVVASADPAEVTAIVNVGDDLDVLGLSISPDLDSVLYALAGLADEERGWGRADETWNALASAKAFRAGEPLSAVTARLAAAAGIETAIVPASDDPLRTWLDTPNGSFSFQE